MDDNSTSPSLGVSPIHCMHIFLSQKDERLRGKTSGDEEKVTRKKRKEKKKGYLFVSFDRLVEPTHLSILHIHNLFTDVTKEREKQRE